nr:hypothetical protein [Streptomyces catenulae]
MGSATGAAIRSYGRTHSPAQNATRTKNTPYGVCAPSRSSSSRAAKASSARVLSRPHPRPVSFGAGIRRVTAATRPGSGRRPAR